MCLRFSILPPSTSQHYLYLSTPPVASQQLPWRFPTVLCCSSHRCFFLNTIIFVSTSSFAPSRNPFLSIPSSSFSSLHNLLSFSLFSSFPCNYSSFPSTDDDNHLWCSYYNLKVTCRGAWHCTQHPSVQTLSISLALAPSPDIIPPEKQRQKHNRGKRRSSPSRLNSADHSPGRNTTPPAGEKSVEGVTGCAVDHWSCSRCTCLNAERRYVRVEPVYCWTSRWTRLALFSYLVRSLLQKCLARAFY